MQQETSVRVLKVARQYDTVCLVQAHETRTGLNSQRAARSCAVVFLEPLLLDLILRVRLRRGRENQRKAGR